MGSTFTFVRSMKMHCRLSSRTGGRARGCRAVEDRRSPDQSDGTWRERIGRFRSSDPVDAGIRLFRQAGHDPARIARAWVVLMKRLGYKKFVAQGGDWGAIITDVMAAQAPPGLLGIHSNIPGVFSLNIDKAAQAGAPAPSDL
jgi:pimeloyl-ACP methyl ester carboxylesterase